MGKLITFEGTDSSGKQTQSTLIVERLTREGFKVVRLGLPYYDSPTGQIVANPYLGKDGNGYFPEGATQVPSLVASLYYTADRVYNRKRVEDALKENDFVILDRYVHSNLAHHGSKFKTKQEREEFYKFMETLEFDMLKLDKPDMVFFLYMPTDIAVELRKGRNEVADQHELDVEYLKHTEKVYLELAEKYNFETINCTDNQKIKTISQINDEIYAKLQKLLKI